MTDAQISQTVNELFRQEKWAEARAILSKAIKESPSDHWLLTRLSTTYYEERNYKRAAHYAAKAFELAPDCPLVLWDLAGALEMLGKDREAIALYTSLLKKGPFRLAEDECGEGPTWSAGLIADCLFRKGECHEALGEHEKALKLYLGHLKVRAISNHRGSIYAKREVEEKISALRRAHPQLAEDELQTESLQLAEV